MLNIEIQLQILERLTEEGYLLQARLLSSTELSWFKTRKIQWAIEGQVTILGQDVTLCVGADGSFPLCLPKIFLHPSNALGFIPHVEADGYICYLDSEGLLLNIEDPSDIICDAIIKSINVLHAGVSGSNQSDFMNEFSAYWRQIHSKIVWAFLSADNILRKIFVYTDNKKLEIVADDISTVKSYFTNSGKALDLLTRRAALYVPLKDNAFVLPPTPNNPWNAQDIKEIVWKNLSAENIKRLKHLGKKCKSEELVILGLPRSRGGMTLVGISFSGGVTGRHPLLSGRAQNPPVLIQVERHDRDYLLNRGGGQTKLDESRILVVGCGAVGGCVVFCTGTGGYYAPNACRPGYFTNRKHLSTRSGQKSSIST
jgi:molybdopterin-synthase adenylyltransferase